IGALQLLRARPNRATRIAVLGFAGVSVYVAAMAGWLPAWAGGDQLRQVLPSGDRSFINAVTASRFGETSTLAPTIDTVIDQQPWFGYGAGGLATPYDNGWVEALVTAGLIGAAAYTAALLLMAQG